MTSWSDNPRNFTKQYEKHIFPSLIYKECQNICLPAGVSEENASEDGKQ